MSSVMSLDKWGPEYTYDVCTDNYIYVMYVSYYGPYNIMYYAMSVS